MDDIMTFWLLDLGLGLGICQLLNFTTSSPHDLTIICSSINKLRMKDIVTKRNVYAFDNVFTQSNLQCIQNVHFISSCTH